MSRFRLVAGAVLAAATVVPVTLASAAPGDAPVTGSVFRDYDASGARGSLEPGFDQYVVTAYDSTGASSVGVVESDGTYSIDVTGLSGGTDGFRIEFTELPDFVQPGPAGPDSGTTVQFAGPGETVNVGVMNPAQFCGANPELATTCFQGGSVDADGPAVLDFVYEAGTDSTTSNAAAALTPHNDRAFDDQIGAVRGLAHHRGADVLFAAAYAKRHTAYPGAAAGAPNDAGPDTIYLIPRDGSAPTPFVTIEAGSDTHDYTDLIADTGFWDQVGRSAWADIDLSEDESTLYAVNMGDKLIYAIPVDAAGASPVTGTPATLDLAALTSVATDCTGGSWVPGGVRANDGLIYLSATCTADGGGTTADLQAFVYAYDPTTGAATEVSAFPLNYDRASVSRDGSIPAEAPAEFQPWIAAEPARVGFNQIAPPGAPPAPYRQSYYPQAWVTDIEFDEGGNMLIGVTDRFGDQSGSDAIASGNSEGVTGGDTLRLEPSGAGWALTDGDDEFYFSDRFSVNSTAPGHGEITLGHMAVLLGRGEVVTNAFDPAPLSAPVPRPGGGPDFPSATNSAGLIWMSHADGSRTRSYQLVGNGQTNAFGKAAGIGDIELICEAAPIEIGNFVWIDADGDGIQDPGELPLAGVTMNLYDEAGTTLLATVVTGPNGEYYFNNSTPAAAGGTLSIEPMTSYVIRADNPSDSAPGGPLAGLVVTVADAGSDNADSDANVVADFAQIDVTTGKAGANDHTLDMGFTDEYRIGSLVWSDTDNDGIAEAGETPLPGVQVELLDAAGTVIASTTTDDDGEYLFDGLTAGEYRVRIPGGQAQLVGLESSGTPNADANDDTDNDNNAVPDGDDWTSGVVLLDAADAPEPSGETNPISAASNEADGFPDERSNQSVDFGFAPAPVMLELGDTVWFDADNNGMLDDGELTAPGVTVNLIQGGEIIATTTTGSDGTYLFPGLSAGDYMVELPASNFAAGGPLAGATTSTGNDDADGAAPDPDDDVDGDDNGTLQPNGSVKSGFVTLQEGAEPGTGGDSNTTVDFGVIPAGSIGSTVFVDSNMDGQRNPNEPGVANVTVNLIDAVTGDVLATTSTDGDGGYLFDGLPPGEYIVEFVPPSGRVFTTGDSGPDGSDSDADPRTGRTAPTTLGLGQNTLTVFAGLVPLLLPATGSGTAFAISIATALLLAGLVLCFGVARRRRPRVL